MTDRELLELAAKAAGLIVDPNTKSAKFWTVRDEHGRLFDWNPFIDDGDALRLAVTCGLVVDCSRPSAGEPYKQHAIWLDETMSNAELTRRAIVRAAAEIGRNMK